MTPEAAFGQVLREFRNNRGLSQEKVALAASLDRTFVSLLERGLRQPSLRTILNIAAVLEIPPSRLVEAVVERMKF